MGKDIGKDLATQNMLVRYITTDGDARSADGMSEAMKILDSMLKVQRLADPTHLGQGQFNRCLRANFSPTMFSGSTRGSKKEAQKIPSQDGIAVVRSILRKNPNGSVYRSFKSEHGSHRSYGCVPYVSIAEHELPKIALVSAPGSGNTWTRYLLQQLSGIGTGSVYCDKNLRSTQFPLECIRTGVLVVKTHLPICKGFAGAIVLIRNPIFSCVSYFQFRKRGHVGIAKIKLFEERYSSFLEECMTKWEELYIKWLTKFSFPVHLLFYEDMKLHLEENLKGLADFLHINYTATDMCCTLQNQLGKFHRKKGDFKVESVYTADMISRITNGTRRVLEIIHKKFPKYSKFRFESIKPS
ncbi:hypothetical protein ScPMuIL_014010 [Solemya velum]